MTQVSCAKNIKILHLKVFKSNKNPVEFFNFMEKPKTCFGLLRPQKKTFITFLTACTLLILVPTLILWDFKLRKVHSGIVNQLSPSWPMSKIALHKLPADGHFTFPRFPPRTRLINISDFEFLINPEICHPEEDIFMLVLVGSHPKNILVRDAIRRTWGNPNITGYPIKLAFVFGKLNQSNIDLKNESDTHGDIIQGNFLDSYHNVTARDMMGLRWAWSYCGNTQFIMHADDDISLDVFLLKEILLRRFSNRTTGFLACYEKFYQAPALREGPYAISRDEYPQDTYDTYCSGWMYILNPILAQQMDNAGLFIKPFWMNDAYITGKLPAALNVPIENLGISYTFNYEQMVDMDTNERLDPWPRFAVGFVGDNVTLIKNLHNRYKWASIMRQISEHATTTS